MFSAVTGPISSKSDDSLWDFRTSRTFCKVFINLELASIDLGHTHRAEGPEVPSALSGVAAGGRSRVSKVGDSS